MALRLGFVGVGGIAQRHLKNAFLRDDVEIVGHADILPERAADAAAGYGGRAYGHCVELYDGERPDAVVIATPPYAHGEIEEEAARRGIHFFVEKPVAIDLALAARVKRAVDEAGILTQVGYMYRFARGVVRARQLLAERSIAMVQQHFYMPGMPDKDWYASMEQGGGQLIEQATHMLDLGRFLAGEVVSVSGRTTRVHDWSPSAVQPFERGGMLRCHPDFSIPDTTALTLAYAGGALGTLSCSLVPGTAWDNGFHIVAPGLILTLAEGGAAWRGEETGSEAAGENWPSYVLYDFLDAVLEGRSQTTVPYEEGMRSLALSVAGYESVRRGGVPVAPADLLAEVGLTRPSAA